MSMPTIQNQASPKHGSQKQDIKINGERLNRRLAQMAKIGATKNNGCNRQALTTLDGQGRALFIEWAKQAGCSHHYDEMGNLFITRLGTQPDLPVVLTGSHLDTQPTGGRFDGVLGVLAGLEVLQTLHERQIHTEHSLQVVAWTNEEGARFSPAMIGSGVWAGEFSLEYGLSREDKDGVSIQQALDALDMRGEVKCQPYPIEAAYELHIEQGPILEDEGVTIGVVTGVQGIRWYDVHLFGQPVHAGPTPMPKRRDPMRALSVILRDIYALANATGEEARATFGDLKVLPGARNTVPEQVTLAVDLRHPNEQKLTEMDAAFRALVEKHAERYGLQSQIELEWHSPAVEFASSCVANVEAATKTLGLSYKSMCSGAGHDSVYVSRVAPTSMIFIPCRDGISHNEAEFATASDIEAGANVLFQAMINSAKIHSIES